MNDQELVLLLTLVDIAAENNLACPTSVKYHERLWFISIGFGNNVWTSASIKGHEAFEDQVALLRSGMRNGQIWRGINQERGATMHIKNLTEKEVATMDSEVLRGIASRLPVEDIFALPWHVLAKLANDPRPGVMTDPERVRDGAIRIREIIIYPWPAPLWAFITEVWGTQGQTSEHCSGMSSFSFWPERVLYDAVNDQLVKYVI